MDLALRAQFHRARACWLGLALTRDLAWSLTFFFASALLSFHLDRRLVLPAGVRLGWGVATVACLAAGVAFSAWWSLRRRPDDRTVALRMERRYPQLRERLLSAVELGRLPGADRERFSLGLLAAVQAEAEAAAGGLDFRRAVRWTEATPACAACGVLGLAAMLHLMVAPAAVAAWWGRMLFPNADIPVYRATRVRVSPHQAVLLRGSDLSLRVLTEGRPVDRAFLHFRVGGGIWTAIPLRAPFSHRIQSLAESADYYATAGDGESDHGSARVVDPPTVVGTRLRYHFPGYMARPDQTLSGVSGMLSAPVGTRIEVAMTASQPLRAASMEAGGRLQPLRTGRTDLTGVFTLWSDTALRVRLQDTDGFSNSAPAALAFHAVPDAAPEVRIEQPTTDQDVVADASVPLHVVAADDHGLHRLWIAHRSGTAPDPPSKLLLAEGGPARRELDARARWNLAGLALHTGDVVVYRAEADDFDNLRGPHTGQSAEQRLRVIDRAEMERRLADGWAEWDQELGAVMKEQAAVRAAVHAARSSADRAAAEERQRDLAPRGEELSRRAGELAEMARTNHLAAPETLAGQDQAAHELAEIARHPMPEAADRIHASGTQPAMRTQAEALQAEIERRLTALRRQAQADTNLAALARQAEELARAQAELEEQSQTLLPATLGMGLDELGPTPQGTLARMAHSQSALQHATGQFEGALGQAARTGAAPAVAAAHLMRERAIPERQAQAATQVAGNLLARASQGQQTLAGDLWEVAHLLKLPTATADPAMTAASRQAAARALRQLQQLMSKHAALMRRTAQRPNAAESRQLARQERALREQAARMSEQLKRSGAASEAMRRAAQQMAQAARQLDRGAPRQAQPQQQRAQEAMQQMAQQLQDQLGDRQAEAARQKLQRDLEALAQRQGMIGSALQNANPAGDPHSTAARLSPRQQAISRSARGLEQRLPSEAFRSAMMQAESAMRRSGAALQRNDVGVAPQAASRQAERLLREMAQALGTPGSNGSPSSGSSGSPQSGSPNSPQNQRELAGRLADLRLLRAMEQGLREETGDANAQGQDQAEHLRDLARRQAQTRGATARVGESLRRFPGMSGRVGEASGAMGQAQQGLQQGQAGAETQGSEATAVMRLTQAIGQAQQRLQAMAAAQAAQGRRQPGRQNGQQAQRRGQQPAFDSIDVHGTDEGGPRGVPPSGAHGFGLLSPRDQQALEQGGREKVPADYADLIHRYYRALSEGGR